MSQAEVLEELRKLPPSMRLHVIEEALHEMETVLRSKEHIPDREARARQMAAAAEALRDGYATDTELTAFTALDGEDFLAQG
ncbi:MAG: hypothetical protein NTX53_06005 [candidate division WOR-3 bacterium]|nr:hypothetical protein [candidate division WOR-3 bacterium]